MLPTFDAGADASHARLSGSNYAHSQVRKEPMSSPGLALLEDRIDALIELCGALEAENQALKTKQQSLTVDRAKLIEKNELAKTRVESMINRLKALEKMP